MIQNLIVKYGFKPDLQNPQMNVTRYIRPFYAIGFAIMYEHETGFMYGVQFVGEDELSGYMNGGFILTLPLASLPFKDGFCYRPKIEFIAALNLNRVNTERQFIAAYAIAEHVVECIIQGINHPVEIGDRVLYDNGNETKPATVTRYDPDGVRVHIVGEDFRVAVPNARLRKLSDHILTA